MIFYVVTSYGLNLLNEGFILPKSNFSFISIILLGFQVTFQSTRDLVLIGVMTFIIIVAITRWAGSLIYFLSNIDYRVIYRRILFILTYVNQIEIFLIWRLCMIVLLCVNELRLQLGNTWL
jgi:ABC-type cobalamin transport system permease subunit